MHQRGCDVRLAAAGTARQPLDRMATPIKFGAINVRVFNQGKAQRLSGLLRVPLSIDTTKAAVADEAVRAGAVIINDISALRADPDMAALAARRDALISAA